MVTANLRGLGEGSTLVLVNGKRISASPTQFDSFTDISTIPFSAIERVEVMADGGSAIYGSDAVGGVINFIMKKNYRGSETRLRYDSSSSGGNSTTVEQNLGVTWSSGNLTASAGYTRQDAVDANKAGIRLEKNFRDRGGRWFPEALNSQPGLIRAVYPPSAPAESLFAAVLPPGDGASIDPGDIIYVTIAEYLAQSGNYSLLPSGTATTKTVLPETMDANGYIALHQELSEEWSVDVTGMFAQGDSTSSSAIGLIRPVIPVANYYNNFGGPVQAGYTFRREISDGLMRPRQYQLDSRRWNLSAGVNWDMPVGGWKAAASLTMGQDRVDQVRKNSFLPVTDPIVAEAISSSDPELALNLFGDGTVQRQNLNDLLYDDDTGSSLARQKVVSLSFSGGLFDLPGGEVQMAVGIEGRTDGLDFTGSRFDITLSDGTSILPESDNLAWHVEFAIPVIGRGNATRGLHSLDLQLAWRSEDYDIRGPFEGAGAPKSSRSYSAGVPKVGLAWRPSEGFKIRASWSEAFQAPRLSSLFSPQSSFESFLLDPLNPAANGGPDVPVTPMVWSGGNPDLVPQTAKTMTAGFDYRAMESRLRLSASWVKTDFKNIISSIISSGVDQDFILRNANYFPGLVVRDSQGILTDFYSWVDANLARRVVEAVDLAASFGFRMAGGDTVVGVNATATPVFNTILAAGLPAAENHGTELAPPEWKGNAYMDWVRGNWGGGFTVRYQGGYRLVDDAAVLRDRVGSYTTIDVQAKYEVPKAGWRFTAGIRNLTDADFPFADNRVGFSYSQVDFLRRVLYLNVAKSFQW